MSEEQVNRKEISQEEAEAIALDILERLRRAGPEIRQAVVRTLEAEGDFAAFLARQRAAGKTIEEIYRGY